MNRLCAFLLVSCFILGLLSLIGKHMFVPDHSQLIFPAITDQSDWKEFHKKQHRTLELWLENNCVTEIMKPTAWGADTNEDDKGDSREKRSMPNWSGSASDFFAWVEQLRSHAGYAKMDELARTFWAHFPSASRLGYEVPEPEE